MLQNYSSFNAEDSNHSTLHHSTLVLPLAHGHKLQSSVERYKYFEYINNNTRVFTSFYTSRIQFPTAANRFRAIISREGLYSSGGTAHAKQPLLLFS
jgi:hypothetical protein